MVASGSKCRSRREPAVIDLPRHDANSCADHLLQLCRGQMREAIDDHSVFGGDDRILVDVSGGKDSLAVWDLLVEVGYHADGFYVGLGIGDHSSEPEPHERSFADERGLTLLTVDLCDDETATTAEVCAFCRLVDVASAHEPVPVEPVLGKRGRR